MMRGAWRGGVAAWLTAAAVPSREFVECKTVTQCDAGPVMAMNGCSSGAKSGEFRPREPTDKY